MVFSHTLATLAKYSPIMKRSSGIGSATRNIGANQYAANLSGASLSNVKIDDMTNFDNLTLANITTR
jgi:hypothetical protein